MYVCFKFSINNFDFKDSKKVIIKIINIYF